MIRPLSPNEKITPAPTAAPSEAWRVFVRVASAVCVLKPVPRIVCVGSDSLTSVSPVPCVPVAVQMPIETAAAVVVVLNAPTSRRTS
jgi:hypothetical protein